MGVKRHKTHHEKSNAELAAMSKLCQLRNDFSSGEEGNDDSPDTQEIQNTCGSAAFSADRRKEEFQKVRRVIYGKANLVDDPEMHYIHGIGSITDRWIPRGSGKGRMHEKLELTYTIWLFCGASLHSRKKFWWELQPDEILDEVQMYMKIKGYKTWQALRRHLVIRAFLPDFPRKEWPRS